MSTGRLPWFTENSFADRTNQMFIRLINEVYNNDAHRLSIERFPKHFHPRKLHNSLLTQISTALYYYVRLNIEREIFMVIFITITVFFFGT